MTATMHTERLVSLADRLGIPTTVLAVVLLSFYQATQWAAENVLVPYVDTMKSTLTRMREDTETNTAALIAINKLVLDIGAAGEERTVLLQAILAEQKQTTAAIQSYHEEKE
jgi:hypothetical protein